jgi:hypothetical protein
MYSSPKLSAAGKKQMPRVHFILPENPTHCKRKKWYLPENENKDIFANCRHTMLK